MKTNRFTNKKIIVIITIVIMNQTKDLYFFTASMKHFTSKEDDICMKKNSAPTMKDVAQEAGVALGTVSKVFNGIPVGESYRIKVEEAAKRLGYQVNNYARGLRANKTNVVALIIPSTMHPFFGMLADRVSRELIKRNYRLLLAITGYDPETEQKCLQMVRQNKVDGIIALTYSPDLKVEDDLPFVSIDRYFSPNIPCITSDNFGGGQLAAEKLIELGCKRLLFLRIGSVVPGEADKRGAGFEAMCQMKKVNYTAIRLRDEEGEAPFYEHLKEHISDGRLDYDGIFCSTDRLAYHIRKMLEQLGIRVPEDVQIIGFDGLKTFGDETYYCSTILQPIDKLAETAVDLLLSEDRSKLPALMCLPVTYAFGGTTKE